MPKFILVPIDDKFADTIARAAQNNEVELRAPRVDEKTSKPRVDEKKIERLIKQHPHTPRVKLLRQARAAGLPCSQRRFKEVFDKVRAAG